MKCSLGQSFETSRGSDQEPELLRKQKNTLDRSNGIQIPKHVLAVDKKLQINIPFKGEDVVALEQMYEPATPRNGGWSQIDLAISEIRVKIPDGDDLQTN